MTDIIIDAGTLTANREERIVTGLLLPYNEECRSNLGKFTFATGAVGLPQDVTGMSLNVEHARENVVGAPVTLSETPAGIVASFRIANTPEGDQALEDVATGKRKHLSAEVSNVKIKDGKGIGGRLFAAALVERPAFPSATLLAAAVDTEDEIADTDTDIDQRLSEIEKTLATLTTPPAPAVEVTEPSDQPADEEEGTMPEATVPATLQAGANKKKDIAASEVFDMMSKVMTGEDSAGTLLAALTDIKISGSGTLPVGGTAVQPSWLGEVYQAKAYQTRYKNLIRRGNIVAIDEKGFSIATGAEPVQTWAGNKAEISSASGTTAAISSTFQRWGVANDIAREFYDIPAGRPVIEAYVRLLVNSYERVTDKWTLAQLITAAGTAIEYDATDVPTTYSAALAKVIQVIDLVDATDAEPTAVVVASDVWSKLRYTAKDAIPEYISFSLNRAEGSADGGIVVLKDKTSSLGAGEVLGISREAAHVNELPGAAPLQLDALDIAHGGIDKAVIGYTQFMAEYAAGLVLLGDPAE